MSTCIDFVRALSGTLMCAAAGIGSAMGASLVWEGVGISGSVVVATELVALFIRWRTLQPRTPDGKMAADRIEGRPLDIRALLEVLGVEASVEPWKPIETAPFGLAVETAIIDDAGERNLQTMRRDGLYWLSADGLMHLHDEPTHWRLADRMCFDSNQQRGCGPDVRARLDFAMGVRGEKRESDPAETS